MVEIDFIRKNPELVIERLKIKHFDAADIINEILELDEDRRQCKLLLERAQGELKRLSKELGILKTSGNEVDFQKNKIQTSFHKAQIPGFEAEANELNSKIHQLQLKLPNLPSELVPPGKTPEENVTVREGGSKPELPTGAVPHWELAKRYDLIDFELGNKVTGSGFPFYKGKGAKLQRALIQYFLDFNTAAGYTEYMAPLMVNEASALGTGQLPDKEGQMYHSTVDNLYLIPTSEVPLTNIYRDTILKETELPVKMTAYTPCFRREAGSYGAHVRGLNRLHQFDKVEIVQLVHPSRSYEILEEMVAHVEKLVQSLELPYRILRLCGGDMSFASALTYDFEVWSAAQEKWLEVSSVSNFETYQTNRMKARFKEDGKTQLLHSLNGSSLALPRILAALLENNQDENGIRVPVALHRYFGSEMI
ncbi:serine--tRNA ligase [Flaviaesturariibacter aridisoli]|uniref:Serine--tRNA ligase n=1 Tax=Flaviaesturariibacter aridisoli TaxID=2545761 RepID=A0A4R4E0B0_9BACT|nr:serine--tRNA ligase [Flaviaesturariibacter aridisoli]TCZ70990.1 serine--tRNA ligase [Flaviaesturariibacter aridisoli]